MTPAATENKSTGPRTEAGKAVSSRNAFKHGLASSQLIIAGEDQADFDALHNGFVTDFSPSNTIESTLVYNLAKFQWLTDRAIRLQGETHRQANTENWDGSTSLAPELSVLIRYQNTNQRAFFSTLKSLQAIAKERKSAPKEFVSQTASQALPVLDITPEEFAKNPYKKHPLFPLYMIKKGITDPHAEIDKLDLANFFEKYS